MTSRWIALLSATALLIGCATTNPASVARLGKDQPQYLTTATPPLTASEDACHARETTPAVIETVTEQVLLQPASVDVTGTVLYPAVYKTETRQKIVRERKELWFETPCPELLTPDFIASLQRALSARGYYIGPISGRMGPPTRWAVRRFQKEQGLDSATLSIAAARHLGLIAFQPY